MPRLERAQRKQGEQLLELTSVGGVDQEPQQRRPGGRPSSRRVRVGGFGARRRRRRERRARGRWLPGRRQRPGGTRGGAVPRQELGSPQRHHDPDGRAGPELAGLLVDPVQLLGDELREQAHDLVDQAARVGPPAPATVADDPDHAAVDDDLALGVHGRTAWPPLGL